MTATTHPTEAPWLHQRIAGRPAEPQREAETRLRGLHGAEAAVLLSGAAAATAHTLSALTNPGGHVIVPAGLSGPVREFLAGTFPQMGRTVSYTDCADVDAVASRIRPETQLVLVESLADPSMRPTPVNELAEMAHGTDLQLVVDNTALSPALLRPLDLGATLVVENCTPYLDDHADTGASVVCGPHRLVERVTGEARRAGGRPDPWAGRLLDRALRTLGLRMAAHSRNADEVADFLRGHPEVGAVHRPNFDESPWAIETHQGFGGLLSFESRRPLSLPDPSGPISLPAYTSHAGLGAGLRESAGITRTLVRVAVDIDEPVRLIGLLRRLLDAPATEGRR